MKLLMAEVIRFSKDLFLKRTLVSSAKRIVDILSDNLKISLLYIKISEGESTEPWGNPMLMVYTNENFEFTRIWYLRSEIKLLVKLKTFPLILYLYDLFWRILWCMVSKAFW